MQFGVVKFECPAKDKSGPIMIGVSVGASMRGVDEELVLGLDGDVGFVLGSGLLDSGREAYVGLGLRKVRK
ncbi:MAG: hypothetical protein CL912_15165 [Deltaproteobacteria bacterium]|nr:hypothetical protein [Deltaproteobacteria bacterium]|tara:strand:- start:383 stop:595 length:213 start_codon:yes stop_codon:yes gene_type:complete